MRYGLVLICGIALLAAGCGQPRATLAHAKPVSHWVGALHDPDARVRHKAVQALGNVGPADPAAIPALIEAVKDQDAKVREEAILALLKIGPAAKKAIPALTEAARDKNVQVRSYAVKALAKIGGGE